MREAICFAVLRTCVTKPSSSTVINLKIRPGCSLISALLFCATAGAFAQPPLNAAITVEAAKVENAISPLLYGQFAEFMFEDIKGGLTAELIRDRSFDEAPNAIGLPRHWERYPDDRNDDPALNFRWDSTVFYPARVDANTVSTQHSLQVEITYLETHATGIRQPGIPVRAGIEYIGYLWIKSKDYSGGITMALQADETDGQQYASADLASVGPGDWKRYEFRLRPEQSDKLAQLAILFRGKGHLWVDQVSLLPADAEQRIRHDVEEKVAALHPAFLRWPGGNVAQDYHWMWGVGPRDQRPLWVNLSWKNELEPGDFGTDEYIKLCRRIGAEPSITVNVEGRGATADEAAAWVEYTNGPASSRYGSMRAANGNREPYGVKYWEVGNEIWGSWVRGHSDAATYANNLNRYVQKMKAIDPNIKIIACGDNDMNWNRTVLKMAGRNIDYLAIHHYYGHNEMKADLHNLWARPLHYERFYVTVQQAIHELVPGRDIKLAINEWNTTLPLPQQHSMESAVYGARLMNVFERTGDLVQMSSVSDVVNGWIGGIIQASRTRVFTTPTYSVNELYASHLGTQRLASSVDGPTFTSTLEGRNVQRIDAVASRTSDRKRIFLKIVNTDPEHRINVQITVTGTRIAPRAEWKLLNADKLDAANDFNHPDAVHIKTSELAADPSLHVVLPQHSVSVITLEAEP